MESKSGHMKRLSILSLLIVIINCSAHGQEKLLDKLTDTSTALGIIKENCIIGKAIGQFCVNGNDKEVEKGTWIVISGVRSCSTAISNDVSKFYQIILNNKPYFIDKDKLVTNNSYYSQLENMPQSSIDSFGKHAKMVAGVQFVVKSSDALKFLKGCKAKGVVVLDWDFYDESEYTEGTSVKLKVYNPTDKVIKYLWFSFVGYNAVGDKVVDRKRGANITMQGIGPINPNESGTYSYEYVWFTDLVENVKIINIKVQYMDGTIKNITNAKEVLLTKDNYELLFGEEN